MMSSFDERKEILKNVIKLLHSGSSVEELKEKYSDLLSDISPFEIPLIEQELVKEGISVREILSLCDLHVALFRDSLAKRELKGVPEGHPLDILMRENEEILRNAEALGLYARALKEGKGEFVNSIEELLSELRKLRSHYRKNQMLIFPYLERRGITAVPRVLWGREDQVIVKMRELWEAIGEFKSGKEYAKEKISSLSEEVSREIIDLVFRENKILYPACWSLFSEGEWAAIHEILEDMGVERGRWSPKVEPIYPYQLIPEAKDVSTLPAELRALASSATPDDYEIRREGDIEMNTGFLSVNELEKILRNLPIELTFADENDRIRFFTESSMRSGFIRTKTIIGRRLSFCHPPRIESYVMLNVKRIKEGEFTHREFWTKVGDRVMRVIIAGIRDDEGRYLGTLEIVEDLTEILENPEEIRKKIMVL